MRPWALYLAAVVIAFCGSALAMKIVNGMYFDLLSLQGRSVAATVQHGAVSPLLGSTPLFSIQAPEGSPLEITLDSFGVRSVGADIVQVPLVFRNVSAKPIRNYRVNCALEALAAETGALPSMARDFGELSPGQSVEIPLDFRRHSRVTLAVDYVAFRDGTVWSQNPE